MTARQLILRDLLTSPSTAAAIHDHTDLPTEEITTILADEEIVGTVESRPLKMLTVWHLTSEGRDIAMTFPSIEKFPA